MPLDNLDLRRDAALENLLPPKPLTLYERLAALGITPVDPTIVSQHKMAWSHRYRYRPEARWIDCRCRHPTWYTFSMPRRQPL